MSFYQKYRSEKIDDLDLTSVRLAFESMMKSGEISHAYLFVGPRGLGKTSAARILARLVNCERNLPHPPAVAGVPPLQKGRGTGKRLLDEPCGECDACVSIKNGSAVDVMEIDAASHRGIDDIRDLREKVNLAPSVLSKKVYIIDEVHMLTSEAFNALLKTLEEPPAQVMFILCTTEAHKVPETIVSRCVRINFTKATPEELVRSLTRAAKGEGLKVMKAVLEELADGLDGSFREGHKLLEQLANRFSEITVENVRETLKLIGNSQVEAILTAVRNGDTKTIVKAMEQMEAEGIEAVNLATKLLESLKVSIRKDISEGKAPSGSETRLARRIIKVVPKIKVSPLPLLPLELVLEEAALTHKSGGTMSQGSKFQVPSSKTQSSDGDVKKVEIKVNQPESNQVSTVGFDQVVNGWQDLLSRLSPRNHSVAGLLRSAKPKEIRDKFLTIEVFYKFHKDQLEQEARRRIIEEEIAKMWGPISVRCVLGERVTAKPAFAKSYGEARNDEGVKAAEEVFGI